MAKSPLEELLEIVGDGTAQFEQWPTSVEPSKRSAI
jgi:hypothetical protein